MPRVVALELDPTRYRSLLAPPDTARDAPLVYRIVSSFQSRIADVYGVKAGDEMRAASDIARDLRLPVALIDMDARVVFNRLRRELPLGERLRLIGTTLASVVVPSSRLEEEVETLANDYSVAFEEMARRFPTLKRILIDERDAHMTEAVLRLEAEHGDVVAVVGDGHVDGMLRHLAGRAKGVDTVRLKALRASDEESSGTATARFTVETK